MSAFLRMLSITWNLLSQLISFKLWTRSSSSDQSQMTNVFDCSKIQTYYCTHQRTSTLESYLSKQCILVRSSQHATLEVLQNLQKMAKRASCDLQKLTFGHLKSIKQHFLRVLKNINLSKTLIYFLGVKWSKKARSAFKIISQRKPLVTGLCKFSNKWMMSGPEIKLKRRQNELQ